MGFNNYDLILKRIRWIGWDNRKVPIELDSFLSATFSSMIPTIKDLKDKNKASDVENCAKILINHLMNKDIGTSHFPTLLQKSEAPNYHFADYKLSKDNESKEKLLNWLLTFYYIELKRRGSKYRTIIAIRSENEKVEKIIDENFRRIGSPYHYELKSELKIRNYTYSLPLYPTSTYYTLLFLVNGLLDYLRMEDLHDVFLEALILINSGGNKWSTIYHPIVNIKRLYQLFFAKDEDLTEDERYKFCIFLESLKPPKLQNQNIIDSYYALLSSLSYSILLESYLNVQRLSQVISEKISLELRAKSEKSSHSLGKIYFVNYVQTKFYGGGIMSDFENLRRQMIAIANKIGELAKDENQRRLLKRLILDLRSEELPVSFTEKLIAYLSKLEREGIKITVPQSLVTLPLREFFIIKNEFIVTLWNKYAGGEQ